MDELMRLPVKKYSLLSMLLVVGCMTQLPTVGEIQGRCGDGVVGEGEACDDGNEVNQDACTNVCERARCGDSFRRQDLESEHPNYEACDDGNINDRDACTNACAAATCGDGIWRRDLLFVDEPGFERCDDGNTDENDSCTSICAPPRCGDGIQQANEACDDGNESNADGCLNTCTVSMCGDGFLRTGLEPTEAGYEECDGEADCSDSCELMFCGNGRIEGTEVCDDGNDVLTDDCANCREARCGDGFIREGLTLGQPGYEACDDGNLQAGDECSVECLVDDHGNSIQFATVMVAPERQLQTYHAGVMRGYIHSLTDRDVFAMTAKQSGVYRFDVEGDETGRPICTVYNSAGELAGYNERRVEGINEYRCSIDLYIEANTTAYLEVSTANFIRNGYLYVINLQMPCGNGVVDEGEECDPEAPNSNTFRCRKDCRNRRMITLAGTTGCAIVNDGVKCWGSNAGLMLGENVENARLCPKLEYGRGRREGNAETDVQVSRFIVDVVDSRHRVADLSGGWNEAVCALYGDSGVTHCWGRHGHITPRCQQGVGCYLSDRLDRCPDQVPTPPGFVGACISSPIEYGITHAQQQPQFTSVIGLTVGSHGSCFIQDTNGGRRAACWGFLYNGMVGYQSPGTCEMAGWSMDECMAYRYLVPMRVSMPNGAEPDFIATGTETSCAILDSGRVACWGRNDFGQTGSQRAERLGYCVVEACESEPYLVPVDMGTVIALSVGGDHVCSVNGQGNTFCWGRNDRGQTGLESDDQRCSSNTPCVRRATRLEHLPAVVDIAAGRSHTCALTQAGRVMCWGDNTRGQLGSGSVGPVRPGGADYSRLPVTVGRLGQSLGLTAGEYSNCSRSETGQIYCWGDNAQGQLGDGHCIAAVPSPIQVDLR